MTLRSRNVLVRVSILLIAVILGLLAWHVIVPEIPALRHAHRWPSAAGVTSTFLALAGSVVLSILFRRTMSSPVFFVTFSLVAGACAGVRLAMAAPDVSFLDSIVLMRVVVASHLTFALFVFAAGLHAADQTYRRHGWVIFAVLFVALTLSWTIPVDAFTLRANLTHPVALGDSVSILVAVFLVLGSASYLQVGVRERDRRAVLAGTALFLVATGFELLYYATGFVLTVAGSAGLIVGIALFTQQSYRDQIIE